mgnify:FL=1
MLEIWPEGKYWDLEIDAFINQNNIRLKLLKESTCYYYKIPDLNKKLGFKKYTDPKQF